MARYYFHVKDGQTLADHRGMEFPSEHDARQYAEAMASTVSRAGWQKGHQRYIVVTNEDGSELFSVKVTKSDDKSTDDR